MSSYTTCKITNTNTCWLLISGAVESTRHIFDIIHAVHCLRKRGISDDHIYLFVDYPEKHLFFPKYSITKNIYSSSDLIKTVPTLKNYEHAITIVGGHGELTGVSTPQGVITTDALLKTTRSCPNIKSGIIVLGQCFAGLSNFTDTYSPPQLVLLGATNLNPSLSSRIELDSPIIETATNNPGLNAWVANIFLFYFFQWLANPVDVDGDQQLTIQDAYKYAGTMSNELLRKIKAELHYVIDKAKTEQMQFLSLLPEKLKKITDPNKSAELILLLISKQKELNGFVDTLYLNQESWLLNANFARVICF